jgi:hypothetical protein
MKNKVKAALRATNPSFKTLRDDQAIIMSKSEILFFQAVLYKISGKTVVFKQGESINQISKRHE